MQQTIVIKNLDKNLVERLSFEAQKNGMDINAYVLSLIKNSLKKAKRTIKEKDKQDLLNQSGKWTQNEYEAFLKNISQFDKIDKELWQ